MPPTKFWLDLTYHSRADEVWRFLRYRNRTILAILNLYVAPMPPINVEFNPHYSLRDIVWRISRWLPWPPSWMSEWNELGSSESPHCLPPSFSLIWLTVRKQMSFQDFQDGHHGAHGGYWNGTNLAILNFHVTLNASHQVWTQSEIPFGSRLGLKIVKMAILDIGMEIF